MIHNHILPNEKNEYGYPHPYAHLVKYIIVQSVIKKLSAEYTSVRFIQLKFFVSLSFDLVEGHWECEKHEVMLSCICKALLRE